MCGFCNVWACVCVGVLITCVLLFTVFCIVCTGFLYCFVYVYLFLFVTSVRNMPPIENSTAVNNNNNNNNSYIESVIKHGGRATKRK